MPNHKDFQPELYKVKNVEQTTNAVYTGIKLHYTDSQQSNLSRLPERSLQTITEQQEAIFIKVSFARELFSF